jgi:hypothetical protein
MSAITSFGNIVNSLRSVRDDYNEHLKSVPQYEAFLLFEGSTQKVADTLSGITTLAQPWSMAEEVIAALATARAIFSEHLVSVPEYRALMAIDKLISDVSADLGVTAEVQATAPVEAEQAHVEPVFSKPSALSETVASESSSAEQPSTHEMPISAETMDLVTELPVKELLGIDLVVEALLVKSESAFAEAEPPEASHATVEMHVPVHTIELAEPAPTDEPGSSLSSEAVELFEPAAEKAA